MDKAKKIFYKDKIQSHSGLAKHFGLDEDKLLNVDYNWRDKTLDIYGENEEQNKDCAFKATAEHYDAALKFVQKKVGTKEKLIKWLFKNMNDKKIRGVAPELMTEDAQADYYKKKGKYALNLDLLKDLFFKHPNRAWSLG